MPDSLDLGGGGNSFTFDAPGDTVEGTIVSLDEVQQTDMDTQLPATWSDGQPKMMYRCVLATGLRNPADPADDGQRAIYLRGSKKPESKSILAAVLAAVRAATSSTNLQVGGTLTVTYSGDGVAKIRGWNAPKQYEATYTSPPAATVNLGAPTPPAAAATPPPPAPTYVDPAAAAAAAIANLTPDQRRALGLAPVA